MTAPSKRTNKGFLLSVSVLSAVGLLAALPLSVSAQLEEDTMRDDAAAETSPANPLNDEEDMMMDSDSDMESESMTGDMDDDMMTGDMDDDDDVMMGDMDDDDDDTMTPTASNSPRALW
ncbi:MAG: hypothetical protein AAF716_01955 [Cyanobacteria bacterium P01_D01_bin.1]